MKTVAYFISPHGFGHAARACAIIEAWRRLDADVTFHVFTRVPEWFLRESLPSPIVYHPLETDIGMVQHSPLHEDVAATADALDVFLDFSPARLDPIAMQLRDLGCTLAVCDISPLGIAAARHAGIPAVLVENFTWDWIYEGYVDEDARMARHAATMRDVFASVPHRIQTEPVCVRHPADVVTAPVSRPCRSTPAQTREALGVSTDEHVVLVSMGGVKTQYDYLDNLSRHDRCVFVIPTSETQTIERRGAVLMLPWHSSLYHPDIVAAADVVVGKLGYSTIAETYHAGSALAYFTRLQFRESVPLAAFVDAQMQSVRLTDESFATGGWIRQIEPLLAAPRTARSCGNGADQAAAWLQARK